jgi:hypothetical protein
VCRREAGYDNARRLVDDGHVVLDERDDWSEHHPTRAEEENRFIEEHGFRPVPAAPCSPPSRAPASTKHLDIEHAVAHLHGMLDALARA